MESFTEWRVEGVADITDAGVEEWTRGEKSVPGTWQSGGETHHMLFILPDTSSVFQDGDEECSLKIM